MSLGRSKGMSREQAMEKQQRQSLHTKAQASMLQEDGSVNPEYLREITDHDLQEGTYEHMANLLGSDFVLSKLSEAEKNELKWLVRGHVKEIKAQHPDRDSDVAGEYRKVQLDDPMSGLKPLSDWELRQIEQAVFTFFTRLARSEDGWQQEKMNESIKRSEVANHKRQSGSSWNPFK